LSFILSKIIKSYKKIDRCRKTIDRLHHFIYPVKFVLQMIIGLAVLIMLIPDAINGFEFIHSTQGRQLENPILQHALQTVSFGLAISAGIEMAYMLFTPGPDEAVEPVILSLAAATLYGLSVINFSEESNFYGYAVLIGTFVLSMCLLFYIKDRFISK
jgi:SNF family Na+-dependent transporter